jgi:23S rRNA (uracil1939-C5)-methyltransferase
MFAEIEQEFRRYYMKFTAPVTKNQTLQATIQDLTYEGLGVAKVDHYPLFVENALPGEAVTLQVTKIGKNFGYARVTDWQSKSPDRVELPNQAYRQTGIAPLGHLAYPAQLKFKQHQIEMQFERNQLAVPVKATLGMADPTGYRNKAQVPVREIKGELETGFYRKRSHQVMPLTDFYIQDPEIDKAIVKVRDLLRQYHVVPYDEKRHQGVIRNIMVRRGYYSHELMVILITRVADFPQKDALVAAIVSALPETVSVIQSVNAKQTNVILGPTTKKLFGKSFLRDQLLGLTFDISAQSFYQVNPQQTEKLYQAAIEAAGLTGTETVIDAYCGIGTISLALAQHAKYVYGIEVVPAAVADAKRNAKLNDIRNTKFSLGQAERVMQEWAKDGQQPDVLVVDPPRKGLAPEFIAAVGEMKPKRMVYVSCNPATLARDLAALQALGYHAASTQPVDMFPQTTSIESVTGLSLA